MGPSDFMGRDRILEQQFSQRVRTSSEFLASPFVKQRAARCPIPRLKELDNHPTFPLDTITEGTL
jgi:hypothetical protein